MGNRELNNNWKGGRRITSHGYIEIKVGADHVLRNANGYAYEHRVVAMKILGRPLLRSDIIHHKDGNKQNNSDNNISVTKGNKGHLFFHRSIKSKLRGLHDDNIKIKCDCGCENLFLKYDTSGRPRKYIHGHNRRIRND
jgi:hypothetical protein